MRHAKIQKCFNMEIKRQNLTTAAFQLSALWRTEAKHVCLLYIFEWNIELCIATWHKLTMRWQSLIFRCNALQL